MALRSVSWSLGEEPGSVVENPDRRDFTGNAENTLLINVDKYRDDETCNVEKFEDGDFLSLGPNYDRRVHVHHVITCLKFMC